MDNNKKIRESDHLRQKAEELMLNKQAKSNSQPNEADIYKLIHELQVHHIELELQNEELILEKTKAELAEKKYTELYEFAPTGYLTLGSTGEILEMNLMAANMLGKERSFLIHKMFGLYVTEDTRATFNLFFKNIFHRKIKLSCAVKILNDSELSIYVNIDGIVSQTDGQCFLTLIDISRLIIIENELTEAKVAAELSANIAEIAKGKAEIAKRIADEAVKTKQQFLSNMSHEIRTPLNSIIGFTKVLLKTELSTKQKEYLSAIKMSGDSLIILINDILDLAKVDAGKMTFKQSPFRMIVSISALLHLFEPKIQEKNLVLIQEYDPRIPEVLVGDQARLHQIILNLVSNSIKFTDQGEIVVSIHLLEENEEQVVVEFVVADTGIGIAEDKMDVIFESFQQAYTTTSHTYGGTGLGLAIVKQLIEKQGGTIRVESKINEGSIFRFSLCFQKTTDKAEYESEFVEMDSITKSVRILVVEDMVLNQILMKTILEDFGFACEVAGNGKIAIEMLLSNTYDIVLMDLRMPEMNGYQATEHIRNTMNSNVPIIGLTADVTTADLAKCKALGMNDYIAKPVDEKLLYTKIIGLIKLNVPEKVVALANTEYPLITKCTNLDYLMLRTKSNPDLLMQLLTAYLEQTPKLVVAMKLAFSQKDWNLLYSAVHKMIPSFSIVGINTIFEDMAKEVQEYAGEQLDAVKITELVLLLEAICNQSCKELELELDTLKKHPS